VRYRTRKGKEYDLTAWPKDHQELVRKAYWWYTNGMPYEEFVRRILGPDSPVLNLRKNGPVPVDTPLYDVATDLQFRLGVKQGHFLKDWEGDIDPWPLDE